MAQKVLLCLTKWPPELKIEKNLLLTSPELLAKIQNDVTEMFLLMPPGLGRGFQSSHEPGLLLVIQSSPEPGFW